MAPITSLYTGLLGLLIVTLALYVVRTRWREQVPLGEGDNKKMQQAIRVHGNAIENIPIFLILLFLAELNHYSTQFLHIMGSLFFIARLLHAWGLHRNRSFSFGRFTGNLISWLLISILSSLLIIQAL